MIKRRVCHIGTLTLLAHALIGGVVALGVVGQSRGAARFGHEGTSRLVLYGVASFGAFASAIVVARGKGISLRAIPLFIMVPVATAVVSALLFPFAVTPHRALALAICWAILVLTVWLASTDQLSFSSPWTALVRAAVLITVAGLVAATLQLEYATDDYTTRFGLKRLSGVTWHPNTQGALGAVCVFGSLWPFRARIHLLERLAWLAIGILAIAWSQTYTAALGVVVALAVEAFRLSGRKARIALVAIAVAVACTFSALGPAETATRLARKRQVEATLSLNGRLDHWEEGLDVFAENPISGLGMGSAGLPSASARGFSARRASTHNVLVETALEWGVVGLAGLATGVVMLLLHLRRQAWNALAPVAGLVAMLMLLPTSGLMPTAVISTFAVASAAGEPALRGGRPQRRDEVTELKHLDRPTTRGPTRR